MRAVFTDTAYWLALANPRDSLHRRSIEAPTWLGAYRLVTSDLVLTELLNALSGSGRQSRQNAAKLVRRLIENPRIETVPQTPSLFRTALALYEARPDKDWSLTDCASFVIMDERKITEALTYDQHFVQNAYRALLRAH